MQTEAEQMDNIVERIVNKHTGCLVTNISGKRFGNLVPYEIADYRQSHGKIVWKCKCDCGNICDVAAKRMISGKTKSCGCLWKQIAGRTIIDLTGNRFGKWTVMRLAPHKRGELVPLKWECVCDCGTIRSVAGGLLKRRTSLSCGCTNRELTIDTVRTVMMMYM
jgi:hypothetical protein